MFAGRADRRGGGDKKPIEQRRQEREARQEARAREEAAQKKEAEEKKEARRAAAAGGRRRFNERAASQQKPKEEEQAQGEAERVVIPAHVTFSAYDYRSLVGKTVEEAQEAQAALGDYPVEIRVIERDGRRLPGKKDLRKNRLNVAVRSGVISETKSFG